MRRLMVSAVALLCAVTFGLPGVASAATLLVADFDRGDKPNALGGDYGAWNKDESDPTQGSTNTYEKPNAFGGVGFSLRLDYDVDSPNPAYNGFWMKLKGIDVSKYKKLSFYVRGDKGRGFTSTIKVELKNGTNVGKHLVTGITDQWQRVVVPLKDFVGIESWKALTEFVVVFDDMNSSPKAGTIAQSRRVGTARRPRSAVHVSFHRRAR